MTPMEITLLILGVIIFVISFIVKDGTDAKSKKEKEMDQLEVRRMMERELDGIKLKINEAANDTVDYAVDKAERELEKISNEKIMAVSDYSSTILEEIDNSHKEVMFMYDMLSDKQTDLKNTVRKAEQTVKEVETVSSEAVNTTEQLHKELDVISISRADIQAQAVEQVVQPQNIIAPQIVEEEAESRIQPVFSQLSEDVGNISLTEPSDVFRTIPGMSQETGVADNTYYTDAVAESVTGPMQDNLQNVQEVVTPSLEKAEKKSGGNFMRGFGGGAANNNQRIIELHDQGKTIVDIAKELNLGVGEVKLVIDLFKK